MPGCFCEGEDLGFLDGVEVCLKDVFDAVRIS